jgi:hypothetical protein
MAKIQTKKINVNDFSSTNKSDIERLGRSLNPFFDEVTKAISKQLSFEYLFFEVTVDASGTPTSQVNVPTSLSAVQGMICVSATNSNGSVPNSMPFISFNLSKNVIQVNVVKGLPANTKFSLTVMVIG